MDSPKRAAEPMIDTTFTKDISQRMRIPEHIVLSNPDEPGFPKANQSEAAYLNGLAIAQSMQVPEHIFVANYDHYIGVNGNPRRSNAYQHDSFVDERSNESSIQLVTPPRSLRLAEMPDEEADAEQDNSQHSAVKEKIDTPLSRLRRTSSIGSGDVDLASGASTPSLRRQLHVLQRRVDYLEYDMQRRTHREMFLYGVLVLAGVGYCAVRGLFMSGSRPKSIYDY